MHDTSGLAILIILATLIFLSPYFSKILKSPIAPVEIALGSILGYFGLLGHNQLFELVSEVGFFYLMFLAGMEIDLRIFFTADKKILQRGIIYILILYLLSILLSTIFGLNKLFILIIPLMSVGMVFTLFKEYGKNEKWLNLSMLIGSIGELASIVLLSLVSTFLQFGISTEFWKSIAYLSAFLILSVLGFKMLNVIFWWYPNLKTILMPHYDKNEKDIRLSMALFFAIIAIMIYLKIEIAFGAFIAGTFIATFFSHKKDLPHKLASFGFGFLVPIFFIYIGSTFKLNSLSNSMVLLDGILITAGMIIVRIIASLAFINLLKSKERLLYALSHSMPLTLLIAVATIAHKTKHINDEFYSSFILASLLQVIISMMGIKLLNKRSKNV